MRFEWTTVKHASPTVAGPGTKFGRESVDDHAVVLGDGYPLIVEGSRAELRAFGRQIGFAFADADDTPAVTFDREAFRAWCAQKHDLRATRGERAGLNGDYDALKAETASLVERVLHELREGRHRQVWSVAVDVSDVSIWTTCDAEGVDGGGAVTVEVEVEVDGIEMFASHLQQGDLVVTEYDDEGERVSMSKQDAAEQALGNVAEAVNRSVARFRAATGQNPKRQQALRKFRAILTDAADFADPGLWDLAAEILQEAGLWTEADDKAASQVRLASLTRGRVLAEVSAAMARTDENLDAATVRTTWPTSPGAWQSSLPALPAAAIPATTSTTPSTAGVVCPNGCPAPTGPPLSGPVGAAGAIEPDSTRRMQHSPTTKGALPILGSGALRRRAVVTGRRGTSCTSR